MKNLVGCIIILILVLPLVGFFYLVGNDGVDNEAKEFLHVGSYVVGKDFPEGKYKLSKVEFNGKSSFRLLNSDGNVKAEDNVISKYFIRLQNGDTLNIYGNVSKVGFKKVE